MATIDHLYFPHIIDLIWQYLDYEGQLATRAACKDWKTRADARLRHIVLSCSEPLDERRMIGISTRDLSGSAHSQAWLGDIHPWHSCEYDKCGRPRRRKRSGYSAGEKAAIDLEDGMLFSNSTAVVDFIGLNIKLNGSRGLFCNGFSDNSLILTTLLQSPCAVRWFGTPPTLSDFYDEPSSLIDVFMFTYHHNSPIHTVPFYELSKREFPQVVNYLCLCDPTVASADVSSLWNEDLDAEACPVVVILHNSIPEEDQTQTQLQIKPGLIAAYGDLVHGGSKVTVVGLEQFLGSNDRETYITVVERRVLQGRSIYDYEEDGIVWWVPEKSCLENLRFITHAEYREQVGEKTYRLHTVR